MSKRKRIKSLNRDKADSSDCYVEFWQGKNFEGKCLRLKGPAEYKSLTTGSQFWGDQIGSLRVGPTAFVLAYAEDDFTGEMITFGPCQEVPDLSEFNFDDEIDSVKLINSLKVFEQGRGDADPK